jgi:hypothetical protein
MKTGDPDSDYDLIILYARLCYFVCLEKIRIDTDEDFKESCLKYLLKV